MKKEKSPFRKFFMHHSLARAKTGHFIKRAELLAHLYLANAAIRHWRDIPSVETWLKNNLPPDQQKYRSLHRVDIIKALKTAVAEGFAVEELNRWNKASYRPAKSRIPSNNRWREETVRCARIQNRMAEKAALVKKVEDMYFYDGLSKRQITVKLNPGSSSWKTKIIGRIIRRAQHAS